MNMSVWYQPIPLDHLRSIEMIIRTGVSASGTVYKRIPVTCCCHGFCCDWAQCGNCIDCICKPTAG